MSVGWLERYHGSDRNAQLATLRDVMHPNIRKFHKKDKLAILNVGNAIESVRTGTGGVRAVRILHEPSVVPGREDEAHSAIYDTSADEARISELLVEAIDEAVSAR